MVERLAPAPPSNGRLDTVDMLLNMGPQHPSTHGVFRMVLRVDGERIVGVEPHIGYLHRGTEKLCERENYRQIVTLFDRLDYLANFNNELCLALTVEKLMGLEVPPRAQYIRVILAELNRIASHLMFYGAFGTDVGVFATPFMYGFIEREHIQALFESVSGARMMHSYIWPGGVEQDLPPDFHQRLYALLTTLRQGIDTCDHLLSSNEIFVTRTRGVGAIAAQDAIDYGMSGPALRAAGVAEDVRRSEPYLVYDQLDFEIPIGTNGDCWDRYQVRMEEMRQSLRIIEQAAQQMPVGPVLAKLPRMLRPPAGEVYMRAENPRGDFGIYLVSEGKDKPYRLKIRGPSFCNLMALQHLLRDCYLADCVAVLGSLDIVLGEVDR